MIISAAQRPKGVFYADGLPEGDHAPARRLGATATNHVAELRFFGGLSVKETAEALSKSVMSDNE